MEWLTMGMLLSLPMIAAGLIIMWYARRANTQTKQGVSEP
jgi:prolipoprotein diacylglyceryltransferase